MDQTKQLNVVMKAGITPKQNNQEPTADSNEPIEVDFSALFPESSGYTFQTVPEKVKE